MRSLVIVAVLVIIQNANAKPQSAGARVVSRSIAGGAFNGIPEIYNDLLPPLLPGEELSVDFHSAPLLKKIPVLSLVVEPPPPPSSAAPATTTTRTTTTRTTTRRPSETQATTVRIAPVQRPQTNKFQQQSALNTVNHGNGQYKSNGDDGSYRAKGETGTYKPKGNLGYYTHNNAGAYKHDDRGKYRRN